MATVSVSVRVDKRELERLIRQSPALASREVARRTDALRDDVVRRMPRRTGKTAGRTVAVRRGPYDGAVEIPEVPGRFLIEGTRPHVIRGNPLRFLGRGGGVVFARVVHHPGTRANPFAADAARAALSPFQRAVALLFGGG
jgi:hypothetical protein